ncbi:serine protease [Deinococcus sp. SDU3-2]|uniref:Serine protease n=1 Tax=Deinococcus terrestris TaxID=2651870 RepID=A0A7X1NX65_9DEIO|nr:S1C family serine protease [Deinococcus terrestris]MPY67385.1 serine protease [Deinococcus terrestris]
MRPLPWLPVLLLLALAAYLLPGWSPRQEAGPQTPPAVSQTLAGELPSNTSDLFQATRPAVVQVESLNTRTREAGLGTGFFISEGGQVMTAYHVVSTGQLFRVRTLEGRTYRARVTAYDAAADVALMQVEGGGGTGGFPFLPLAEAEPRVGQEVLAIGNSGGDFLQPRRGVLLRLGAEAGRADFPQGTLEMSAPLAPGDSGGPILDGTGQVIGVVSFIRLDESNQTQASYAVPVTQDSPLAGALLAGEQRDVPVVGLVLDITHSGLTDPPGAVIQRVARNSPAEEAGLRGARFDADGNLLDLGDVILSVNGRRVRDANDFIRTVRGDATIGDTIRLGYLRDGEEREATITLVGARALTDLSRDE